VAVSVSLVPASVYLRRTLGASDNGQVLFPAAQYGSEATVQFSGSAFGVGANAGLLYTPIEHLKLGFSFRSAVGLDFSGKVHFNLPSSVPASIRAQFPDGAVTTQVTLPHVFSLGVGWVDGPLTVEADLNYTLWSSFDQLRIDFAQALPQASTASHYNYNNAPTLRLGGEYRFDFLAARLGVGYDWTPIPDATVDPTLPDSNRFLISAGVGTKWEMLSFDVSYLGVILTDRSIPSNNINFPIGAPGAPVTNVGTYAGGVTHVLVASVGAKF
jgi:long-chain fatty acid transport protein